MAIVKISPLGRGVEELSGRSSYKGSIESHIDNDLKYIHCSLPLSE